MQYLVLCAPEKPGRAGLSPRPQESSFVMPPSVRSGKQLIILLRAAQWVPVLEEDNHCLSLMSTRGAGVPSSTSTAPLGPPPQRGVGSSPVTLGGSAGCCRVRSWWVGAVGSSR